MQRRNYDMSEDVSWREVLKNMEYALTMRMHSAFTAICRVNRDRVHNYPEDLEVDLKRALLCCDAVFDQYKLLSSVRRFLKYKPKTIEQLELSEIFYFYLANKEDPHGADLLAQHHEDTSQR